jgi:hypothetical protein
VESHGRSYLSGLKDDDLARMVEFVGPGGHTRSLPVGEMLEHAAIHGVHHRAQVALLLRLLGHAPDGMDMLMYDLERGGASRRGASWSGGAMAGDHLVSMDGLIEALQVAAEYPGPSTG